MICVICGFVVLAAAIGGGAVGLAIGLPVVVVVSRLIGTMLFEVSPTDPATVAAAMLALLVVGLIRLSAGVASVAG